MALNPLAESFYHEVINEVIEPEDINLMALSIQDQVKP